MTTRSFRRNDAASQVSLTASMAEDRLPSGAVASLADVHRIEIVGGAAARGMLLTSLDFSGVPSVLLGRSLDARRVASVCPAPREEELFTDPDVRRQSIGHRASFGAGWDTVTRQPGITAWRLKQSEGELLFSLARAMPMDVLLSLLPIEAGGTITLRINGIAVAVKPLITAGGGYRWVVPANLWRAGLNEVFVVSQPGIRVSEIELVRESP
jgi:hypothetical protein